MTKEERDGIGNILCFLEESNSIVQNPFNRSHIGNKILQK